MPTLLGSCTGYRWEETVTYLRNDAGEATVGELSSHYEVETKELSRKSEGRRQTEACGR